MKIAISSGHSTRCQGAVGPSPWGLNEVAEATRVVDRVADLLNSNGHPAVKFHDTTSTSQNENLNRIVSWHNQQSRELDISVHFNAYTSTSKPMGTEVLYVTQSSLASRVSAALAAAQSLPNRGGKYRSDLAFLNGTNKPAILIEVAFVDSTVDAANYRTHFEDACMAIVESVTGQAIQPQPPEPPEPEPEPPLTGENRVVINGETRGDVTIYVNDNLVKGHENCEHVVDLQIKLEGDVTLVVNGEEFHSQDQPSPPDTGIQDNHTNVEATVFGGASDPNNSAYPPYDALNDTDYYVALPYTFSSTGLPLVRVHCNGKTVDARVRDKGPWTTDDVAYVQGLERPIAETCHQQGTPLPSGPNAGRVPSNMAGIDLSPAVAKFLGISGKGRVDWEIIDE